MTKYDEIIIKIIKEQELLMGPVAWYEARKVSGLIIVDEKSAKVSISEGSDVQSVVNDLVAKYSSLFGRAAEQVCKEAVSAIIADLSPHEIPVSLRG